MSDPRRATAALADRLDDLGWVRDLWVAGSLASGDHVPGVSDLDLVATCDGPVTGERRAELAAIHGTLDLTVAAGCDLGCVYVDESALDDLLAQHPTWTHGALVDRVLSGITRAELVGFGLVVLGRPVGEVLAPVSPDDVRTAARDELGGYWAMASRHPTWWLDPTFADLSLTSMARGRHALRTGELLSKPAAIDTLDAPPWLAEQVAARRRGRHVVSPRVRTAWLAWRDTRRTTSWAARWDPSD